MMGKILIVLVLLAFLPSIGHAITISENATINPSGMNTTFKIYDFANLSRVEVNDSIYINNISIIIRPIPSNGSLNVTILNASEGYRKWVESNTSAGISTEHILGNFTNRTKALHINNVYNGTLTPDSSGFIKFNYTGYFSDVTFEISDNIVTGGGEELVVEDETKPIMEEKPVWKVIWLNWWWLILIIILIVIKKVFL